MCIYVHVIRDRCHTIPFSGSKQHWDTSALHMFVPNYDLSHCDWNWILWYFSLAISIESMVLDGLVAQRDPGSFGIASIPPTLPGFDISVRFHHSTGIPVAQHVQRMMALGTFAGFPDVLGQQLILIHTRYCTSNEWLTPHKHAGQWQTWICPCFLPDI